MKIAVVGAFGLRPKATVSTRAIPLAQALVERGHQVTVIVPPWDNPSDSGKELFIGKLRVLNVSLPPFIPLVWYLLLTWRLIRETLRLRPEVVHLFKPKAFAGLVASALWLSNLLGITSVRIVVDTDDWEGAGGWNEIGGYSRAQRFLFPLQERWVLRQADAVTVASRTLEEMVSDLRGDKGSVFYLPNAIGDRSLTRVPESNGTARARLGLDGCPVILLYTRFFEFRVERALDVIEEVARRLPEARLLVVGKGFFGEEKELERLARARGSASLVMQAGWVDEADLPAYFAASDVAVYPYDDTLINRTKCSVKLLDLLSAGVPVVADRVGQNSEYIEDGRNGILTESGDSRAMAASVVRLVEDPDLASSIGEEARRRVRSEFKWSMWAPHAEQAYQNRAGERNAARMAVAWALASLWMALIFYMSSQPTPPQLPEPILQTIAAKIAHFAEYAVLAFLVLGAYRSGTRSPHDVRQAILFAALISVLYAISDEFHQSFVPNRHPSAIDVLIDSAGALLTLGLSWRQAHKP